RALVLNGSDVENATAVLVASELGCRADIVALLEEPSLRHPLELAGAKALYTPRHVLGEALAARASQLVQPRVDGIHQLGKNLRVEEIRLNPESPIAGLSLAEAKVASSTGATILGLWLQGELDAKPTPDTRLAPNSILLAVGRAESLEQLRVLARADDPQRAGPILVAGCGEVGKRVTELLREAGEAVSTVDLHPDEPEMVDVVGDIADPKLLEKLDLEQAQSIVLALDSDSSTLFATLVIRGALPKLPIIARVNRADNLDRIYRAGVDFALSISQVSAKILAERLLGRASIALDTELQLLAVEVTAEGPLSHRHPSAIELRKRSGCSVVCVERGEDVITHLDESFRFQPGDTVYVCGHHSDTERFAELCA
ncbi:MAG: NAD-binding protein, partial [Holophagales bacterium]|nr:NAD-binding protein [Holophagales bacterium]